MILVIVGLLALGYTSFTIYSGTKSTQDTSIIITAQYGNISVELSTSGQVQPQNRLEIIPPISGRIEKLFVNEGDTVKKGQVLGTMSSSERAALIDSARLKSKKEQFYWSNTYKEIPLIAPISGTIIVRAVEPGQTVGTSTPILVISDRLIVKAQVDETDIGRVKAGQKAVVSLDAYPDIKVLSRVDHIAYESKLVSNVTIYEVDILPQTIPAVFRSGMSAEVTIVVQSKKNVLTLALSAVHRTKESTFVWVQDSTGKNTAKKQIQVGMSDEKNTEILSGITPSDNIVVQSSTYQLPNTKQTGSNPFTPFGNRRRKK